MTPGVSKQEIRRDPLTEWVIVAIRFIRTRRWLVIGGLVGTLVLGLLAGGYTWYQDRRESEARALLAKSQAAGRAEPKDAAPKPEESAKLLQQVIEKYPRTASGEEALIRLANMDAAAGRLDPAADSYARYLREHPKGRFIMMAVIGRAYALEKKGDLAGAAQTLSDGLDRAASDPLAGEAYIALGRVYESQKNVEAATKAYNQVMEKFPDTQWAQHATSRLSAIAPK
jgi:predicted negative regulator of RcsB-dependent stress response